LKRRREIFGKATYDLDELKKFIDEGNLVITPTCRKQYSRLDYSDTAAVEIVKRLQTTDILKTMPSEKIPDLMQDVYRTKEKEDDLYIKLQKSSCGKKCVIIQFKLL
jgi:predicted nucleotidyltransferase